MFLQAFKKVEEMEEKNKGLWMQDILHKQVPHTVPHGR